ncbi:LPXTG cell wall anchor domain-containing protein [Kitasatospora sp. NPDC085879]|uniref:LPXTG cell wall anchor domain-containing protein n=1 Tax=Kitasatospora sp. NPDC085879 TaxID=3154769 RepID=UPI00343ED9A4
MRAPVISRFVRNATVTTTAALAIGVALPVLTGGTAAWACGELPNPQPAAAAPAAFVAPVPTSVTAGGAAAEFGLEQLNDTAKPYPDMVPRLSLFSAEIVPGSGKLVHVAPEDLTVEVMSHGHWKRLPLRHACDPGVLVDTSSLAETVPAGQAHRYMFRVSVSAKAADVTRIDIATAPGAQDRLATFRLAVKHPKPAPKPTPTTAKPTPTTAALVPTAATPTATRTATPAAPTAPATELAQTGTSSATAFLFASGAAALALGGAVLLTVKRLARR